MKNKKVKVILFLFIFCLVGAGVFYFFSSQEREETQASLNFEEQSIVILTPYSNPGTGDNWVVSFATTGTTDLTITPNDQATIDDLDFVSLTCGGEERTPQTLENDVVFYPDWECEETEEVTHHIKVSGKHTLKFQFGDQIEYAYNNPGTEVDTSISSSATAYSFQRKTWYDGDGRLWSAFYSGSAIEFWYSTDWGSSWTQNAKASISAITYDAKSSDSSSSTSSLSWSHTIGSGPNRILIVGVSTYSQTVSSVTYDGTGLTSIGSIANGSGGRAEIFKLLEASLPSTGSYTIEVTLGGSAAVVAGATSWSGIDQTTPHGTFTSNTGASNTPTVDVSSAGGEMVVDTLAVYPAGGGIMGPGAGQTQRWSATPSLSAGGGGSSEPGETTVTMSWSTSVGMNWAIGAISLKPDTTVISNDFTIEADSSDLFIAYTDGYDIKANEDSGNYPATNFTWGGTPTTVYNGDSATDKYSYPAMTKDSNNKVWITARHYNTGTVDEQVGNNADDGFWREGDPTLDTAWGNIYVGYDSDNDYNQHNSFMRFTNATVPNGATIDTAYFTVTPRYSTSSTTVNTIIDAVDADNASAPTTYSEAENATRTTATVTWNNVPAETADSPYNSLSIVSVIKELVDRSGWTSGNAMVIYWEDNGSTQASNIYRRPWSHDGSSSKAPQLYIEWSNHKFQAIQATGANDISAWGTATTLDSSGNSNKYGTIVPLSDGEMYAVWIDGTTIEGKKYAIVDKQVEVSGDDGYVYSTTFDATYIYVGGYAGLGAGNAWYRWTGVIIPVGATIGANTYISLDAKGSSGLSTVKTRLFFNDAADAVAPTTVALYNGKVVTTAYTDYNPSAWVVNTWYNIDASNIIAELVASYDYSAGAAMMALHKDNGSSPTSQISTYDFTQDSTKAPKLHIEYWGTTTTIDTGVTGLTKNMSAVASTQSSVDYVHLIYDDSSSHVIYDQWDSSNENWTSFGNQTLDSDGTCEYLTLSKNTANNDLYAIWIRGDDIYYSTDSSPYTSWSGATSWQTSGTNKWVTAGYKDFGSSNIFAEWTEGTGSPYSIMWDKIPLNQAPTNDELTLDLTGASYKGTKTLLTGKQDYKFVYKVSDADGVTDITYAEIRLDYATKNVILRATRGAGDTWTFSEQSDPNDYVTLNTSGSSDSTSANQKTFNFLVTINWNWDDSAETIGVRAYVIDSQSASDQDDYTNILGVENDLSSSELTVDDYRCNPSQTLTFSGYWYYEGTTLAPSDGDYQVKIKLAGVQKGTTDTTLVNGAFSINDVTAESTVGSYSYTVECNHMASAGSFDSVIVDKVQVQSYTVADLRVNINDNVNIDVLLYYDYDNTQVTDGTVTINTISAAHQGSGTWRITQSKSTVQGVTYDTVTASGNTHGITTVDQNSKSTTVVWDRIQYVTGEVSDSRADVSSNQTVWYTAKYEYDNVVFDNTKGSFTIGGSAATWSAANNRWERSITGPATAQSVNYAPGHSDTTYGITASNNVAGTQSIIWDRLELLSVAADDTRIDISSTFELRYQIRYDYDNVILDNTKGSITGFTWDSGNSWWDKTVTGLSSVTSTNYDETYISIIDLTYGLTAKQDVGGVDIITDRIKILTLSAVQTPIVIVIEAQGIWYATAELEHDHHALGSGDSFTLSGYSFSWDATDSRFEATDTKNTPQTVTINAFDSGSEATYGITAGNINNLSQSIEWQVKPFVSGGEVYAPARVFPDSLVINQGQEYASTREVKLKLKADYALYMSICNNDRFIGCPLESYSESKSWTLTEGDGQKTVYAVFASPLGGKSLVVSDTIVLKTEVPEEVPEEEEEEIPEEIVPEKPIEEMTIEELLARIAELKAMIAKLRDQLAELLAKPAISGIPAGFTFETTLRYGQRSVDVKHLQIFLKAQGSEIYPEGIVSGWFGPLTKAAVIRFQEKYASDILSPWELTEGTGFVGKTTRAKINEILSR